MTAKAHLSKPQCRAGGFTLVELVVVIALMAMLTGMIVPAFISILESNNLATAGQMVPDQIRQARQIAASKNITVEVRIINTETSGSAHGYNSLQLWSTGTKALSKQIALPTGMAVAENGKLSKLFASGVTSGVMPVAGNPAAPYVAFRIMPSGRVMPAADMKEACVTVLSSRYGNADTLPANYVIVQINPNTGSTTVYRP